MHFVNNGILLEILFKNGLNKQFFNLNERIINFSGCYAEKLSEVWKNYINLNVLKKGYKIRNYTTLNLFSANNTALLTDKLDDLQKPNTF